MAKPDAHDLISQLKNSKSGDYREEEQKSLVQKFDKEEISTEAEKIYSELNLKKNTILKKGIFSAILGALYAFKDRELDPKKANHYILFKEISEDISTAYLELGEENLTNEDIWLFETFDYGIKKVYYLDWTLYLSKICY
ncbi:MAG: hypothetical protein L6Q54_12325 [Leptospiraceae bacterium]|nr:hypothetical protein [Leptospiraceae bacterium]MCK6382018.1 hypothetical protein [Leptospiraceae bacterium]NUM40389.1 hypothetical protein [Leptospiraceae bacterium]